MRKLHVTSSVSKGKGAKSPQGDGKARKSAELSQQSECIYKLNKRVRQRRAWSATKDLEKEVAGISGSLRQPKAQGLISAGETAKLSFDMDAPGLMSAVS